MADDVAKNHDFVLEKTALGEIADFTARDGYDENAKPVVEAGFLRRLMLGLQEDETGERFEITLTGLRIWGARVDGKLDLSDCAGPGDAGLPALALRQCDLPDLIDVSHARLARLSIRDSRFRALWGVATDIAGDFNFSGAHPLLTHDGEAGAYIRMLGVRVDGDLRGRSAQLRRPEETPDGMEEPLHVFNIQSAQIGGSVFLDNGFEAIGCTWLSGAKIGGRLQCSGGRFNGGANAALVAENLQAGGGVFLRAMGDHRFESTGMVYLPGSKIAGRLDCGGGRFDGGTGAALVAENLEVGGAVYLRAMGNHRFESTGMVNLPGSKIGGSLACDGARFDGGYDVALVAEGLEVEGAVLLRETGDFRFEAMGAVNLLGAKIGGDLELQKAKLSSEEHSFVLREARIGGRFFAIDNDLAGWMSFSGAHTRRLSGNLSSGWGKDGWINLNEFTYNHIGTELGHSAVDRGALSKWLKRNHCQYFTPFSHQPYRQAAEALRRAGAYRDARYIMREAQKEALSTQPNWLRPIIWLFAQQMFGYGLSAWRAIGTALAFWLFGALCVIAMQERGALIRAEEQPDFIYQAEVIEPQAALCGREVQPFLYALDVMVPLLDLRQESECKPGRGPDAELVRGIDLGSNGRLFEEVALWRWAKSFYAFFGALVVGATIITFTRIFRPQGE